MIVQSKFKLSICLIWGLCAWGCLASDPVLDPAGKVDSKDAVAHNGQVTSAPLTIDPSILTKRTFGEAPMLAQKVSEDALPPVSERLPENPLVVVPLDEIGRYGGTIKRALTGDIVQTPGVSKTLGENLMGYERPLPKSILYNLAESHEFLDDGKVAIFKIRKGIKWSDGVPFTVDDILFWYHDMTVNPDARANPLFPSAWLVEGKPIEMEKVDDHTLRFRSHKPLGRILGILSTDMIAFPKHAYAQYHPKYNPKSSYEALRDSTTRAQTLFKPGTPSLSAWVPVEWTRGQRLIYERNPYYFKVDSAGNQLPYADRLVFNVIQDAQVILLRFMNGELDLLGRYAQINMFATLKSEERHGQFKVHLGTPVPVSTLRLNWDAPRLELRQAFRDKRVRVALSHAINREELSQILYHGLLEPASHSFGPASQYYSEEASQTYAAYDPDKSRRLLDDAGLLDTDGDGIRELSNGSPFVITIDVIPSMGVDICQLVSDYWKAVGVSVHLNIALRDILFPKWSGGTFEVFWWWGWSDDPVVNRQDWGIMGPNQPVWHRNADKEGPEWLLEATRLLDEVGTTVDPVKVQANMARVRDLHAENTPLIIPGFAYHVWGASTRLGNVPEKSTTADGYRGWSRPVYHEQLYVKEKK
ncbi:MAG: ABC transporter substrate-binding protein [Candidatus Latescibacteria bacterium]|nr:ABC transporter substrate-binding protein [Candidatus Latescibacterota bacterium]MBT4141001.1 ABC transporter substrate-binding protein [Candidatus Latescibacterota bacterium]MBT5829750.1 ABC transporter substrate-binding protein [Candidatus Latescibacterota bacterium]